MEGKGADRWAKGQRLSRVSDRVSEGVVSTKETGGPLTRAQ